MKRRMIRVATGVLLLAAIGVLYGLVYVRFGIGLVCPIYRWTHLLCPGCGITHAVVAVAQGRFADAWTALPLFPLYVLYVGWLGITAAVRYIRGEENPLLFGPNWIHISMLVVVCIFTVWRNIV